MAQSYYDPMMYQQMPQQQQVVGEQYQVNQGLLQQRDDDLIKWIESPQTRVDGFIKVLSGKEFNSSTRKWEYKKDNLIMNEAGEQYWKTILRGMVDTDTILTRLDDEDDIRRIAEPLAVRYTIHAHLYHKKYGMPISYVPIIREIITNRIILTLMRGYKQGERHFLNLNTTHEIKTTSQPKSAPWFGHMFTKRQI